MAAAAALAFFSSWALLEAVMEAACRGSPPSWLGGESRGGDVADEGEPAPPRMMERMSAVVAALRCDLGPADAAVPMTCDWAVEEGL